MRIGPDHVGPDGVRHSVERAVARDDVDGIAALRLHDRGELPAASQGMTGERQLVGGAEHEPVTGVEVRQAVLVRDVVAVLDGEAG